MDPNSLVQQRIAQTELASKQLGLAASQNGQVYQMISGTRTKQDLLNLGPTMARMGLPADVIANATAGAPNDPAAYNKWKGMIGNIAMGPAAASDRVAGAVDPNTGAPTSTTRGAANIAGSYATGAPLGADASAGVMQADLAREGNFAQDMYPWQKTLDLIHELGPGGTGPGTQGRQQVESFLNSLSPTVARFAGVDASKIQKYDEFMKYATQGMQQRAAAFGAHTDSQLATTISGSPNTHLSDLANEDVIRGIMALRRMEHAQAMGAAAGGGPNYTSAKAANAPSLDPRAFALPDMSQAQVDNLKKTITGPERSRFNRSLQLGIQTGAITPPGQ